MRTRRVSELSSNRLLINNRYLGHGKNSKGIIGLCGQVKISNFDDSPLSGTVESSNPLLFLRPTTLSGELTTVTYWLPPVAFPHPAGHLTITTKEFTETLPVRSLFPKSRTELMSDRRVILYLLLPGLIAFAYFAFVYLFTTRGIDAEAALLFPDTYAAAMSGQVEGDFRSHGLGLYRLKVMPAAESLQMIWAGVIFFVPLIASKFFYYLSSRRRRKYAGLLVVAQLLPTVLLLLTWSAQVHTLPLYFHQDFSPLDLRGFLAWGVPWNVAIALYLFLSVFGVWDEKLKSSEVRGALPVFLTVLYLVVMFITIYGRSWVT